jgi:hypothetical protein
VESLAMAGLSHSGADFGRPGSTADGTVDCGPEISLSKGLTAFELLILLLLNFHVRWRPRIAAAAIVRLYSSLFRPTLLARPQLREQTNGELRGYLYPRTRRCQPRE